MPVRSDVAPVPVPAPVQAHPVMPERRLNILPPGERERRRDRGERRRGDRRTQDLGAPYGVERRSGTDDRQADRRDHSKRPAGIGLMRDYFSPDRTAGPPAPERRGVCRDN